MRIAVITQGLSFLVTEISTQHLVGICESAPRNFLLNGQLRKPKPIRSLIRSHFPKQGTLKKFAMQQSIPYFLLHKNNDDEFNEWLRDLRPDAVLVYSMSKLLKPDSLSIPRLGFINFHPSLLPRYRGSNPWFWVFYFAEAESGITVHKIDSGLDTGNILLQESFPIRFGASKLEVVSQFEEQSRRLLPRLFELLSIGKVDGTPQRFSQDEVLAPEPSLTLLTSIEWDEWDVERAFHFLCGMLGEYPQLIAFEQADSRQRLSVTSYTKGSTPPHYIVDEQLSLNCSNGRVFFEWEN